ncbi:MAG: hypothetical protein ACE5K3_00940 [bacterium]
MALINELTGLSILTLLAKKYPSYVGGREIVRVIGKDRELDVEKCLHYLTEKKYIEFDVGSPGSIISCAFKLTAEGIDYLDDYNKKLAEMLEQIKRKPMGFQPDNK